MSAEKNVDFVLQALSDGFSSVGDDRMTFTVVLQTRDLWLMAKLPADLSVRQVRRALEGAGFTFRRQRGSHRVLRRDQPRPAWWYPIIRVFVRVPCERFSTTAT